MPPPAKSSSAAPFLAFAKRRKTRSQPVLVEQDKTFHVREQP